MKNLKYIVVYVDDSSKKEKTFTNARKALAFVQKWNKKYPDPVLTGSWVEDIYYGKKLKVKDLEK